MAESYPFTYSRLWKQACKTENKEARQYIIRKIYANGRFKSGCDYPTSLFVDDLVEMYPSAKVRDLLAVQSTAYHTR